MHISIVIYCKYMLTKLTGKLIKCNYFSNFLYSILVKAAVCT